MVTKEEQLRRYEFSLNGKNSGGGVHRKEEKDIYEDCNNCGNHYLKHRGFYSSDPHEEYTLPIPCPDCFYNPDVNEASLDEIIRKNVKFVVSGSGTTILSQDSSKRIIEYIQGFWPKNLEDIIRIKNGDKNESKR